MNIFDYYSTEKKIIWLPLPNAEQPNVWFSTLHGDPYCNFKIYGLKLIVVHSFRNSNFRILKYSNFKIKLVV